MIIHVEYPVTTSFLITIERDSVPENISDLLESITRDELARAPMTVNELEWGHIKHAWQTASAEDVTLFDEEYNVL